MPAKDSGYLPHPSSRLYTKHGVHAQLSQTSVLSSGSHHLNSFYSANCCCCLVTQLYPTLYDPMGCSSPGSSIHGTSQTRILEWIAISFSRGSSQLRDRTCISRTGSGFFTTEPPGKPTLPILPSKQKGIPGGGVGVEIFHHVSMN